MHKLLIFIFSAIALTLVSFTIHAQPETINKQSESQRQSDINEKVIQNQQKDTIQNSGPSEQLDTTGILRKYIGSHGSFSYGWQLLNIDELNQTLNAFNYPMFSDYAITFGGNGLRMFNCFLFGGEAYLVFTQEKSSTDFDASLNSGYGFFNIGYRGIASSKVLAYPLIGVGGGRSNLKIAERSNGIVFNQLMANPTQSLEISTSSFLLNFSLNLDYFTLPMRLNAFHFGVSVGYIYSLPTDGWYMFNANVQGGPIFNLAGPYIRLKFGGGSFTAG